MTPDQYDFTGDGVCDLGVAGIDYYRNYSGYSEVAGAIFESDGGISGDFDSDEADILLIESESFYWYTQLHTGLDFDGDGRNDAVFADGFDDGYVYVMSGADIGSSGEYSLEDDYQFYLDANSSNDGLGLSMGGGDIDGDGYDDLVIGAPYDDDEADNGGCVFIVYGQSGLSSHAAVGFVDEAKICATDDDAYLGAWATPILADFDGDGSDDLAISAYGEESVYIFMDASSLSGNYDTDDADVTLVGVGAGDFGIAMDTGDFDGDGLADLAIGAPDMVDYDDEPSDEGQVFIFTGSDLSVAAAEIDSDDASAVITSTDTDGFGRTVVAGDMDGDGHDDLFVAAPRYEEQEGKVMLFISP